MSDSASEQQDKDYFTEHEADRTNMTFDNGGVPLYVALIWVVFLASYVAYMVVYGLPDFSAWSG
ncbi:MAG: hypothetical protein RMA76_22175 [Deltaproteobacteria bacterium]|jgi:hypothetical protein